MKKKLLITAGFTFFALVLFLGFLGYKLTHQVQGHYFDSAGVNIHYTDQGAGVPVILVHGYSANSDLNWRLPGILPRLAEHFRVITMDVRGHGRSGKPHDPALYGIEMVNDVLRLMDHLKIAKAHLVGYSMGGFITLKFMAMYPDRLITAMPCGAAWMTPSDPLCNLLNEIHAEMTGEKPGKSPSMASLRRRAMRTFLDIEALGCVAEGFPELAITEAEMSAVSLPVMAVKGSKEEVVLGGGDLKTPLPGYRETIIPGGRHNTVIFYSAFHDALVDFLLENSGSPPSPPATDMTIQSP